MNSASTTSSLRGAPWAPPAAASPPPAAPGDIDPDIGPPLPFEQPQAEAKAPECTPDEAEDMGRQAARDGALYVMRADGERKMMIETIQCAQSGDWMANFGQVDFAPIRSRRVQAIEASCAAPMGGGRTTCRLDEIE